MVALRLWGAEVPAGLLEVSTDNIGALQSVLSLKGSRDLMHVARELSVDKALLGWNVVASHVLSEHNNDADALSRIAAPGDHQKSLPKIVQGVMRCTPEPLSKMWRLI